MTHIASQSVGELLASIAERSPAPGGGAAAGVAGATACSLASMSVAFSLGRPSLGAHQAELNEIHGTLAKTRTLLLTLAQRDAEAFAEYSRLKGLPASDPEREGLARAAQAVIDVPATGLREAVGLLAVIGRLAEIANRNLRSDTAIAGVLAEACAAASAWNVRINLGLLDAADAARTEQQTQQQEREAARLRAEIEAACAES